MLGVGKKHGIINRSSLYYEFLHKTLGGWNWDELVSLSVLIIFLVHISYMYFDLYIVFFLSLFLLRNGKTVKFINNYGFLQSILDSVLRAWLLICYWWISNSRKLNGINKLKIKGVLNHFIWKNYIKT